MLDYLNRRPIKQSHRFVLEKELLRFWQSFDALTFFNRVMDLFFKLLIFFVVIVLGMGLVRLFWEIWRIMAVSELKDAFSFTVTNLLTFFIILELFKSLVEYFREHRLRLTFIVDATLVFILRDGTQDSRASSRLTGTLAAQRRTDERASTSFAGLLSSVRIK